MKTYNTTESFHSHDNDFWNKQLQCCSDVILVYHLLEQIISWLSFIFVWLQLKKIAAQMSHKICLQPLYLLNICMEAKYMSNSRAVFKVPQVLLLKKLNILTNTLTYSRPLVQRTSSSWSGPSPCALNMPRSTTCGTGQEVIVMHRVTEHASEHWSALWRVPGN